MVGSHFYFAESRGSFRVGHRGDVHMYSVVDATWTHINNVTKVSAAMNYYPCRGYINFNFFNLQHKFFSKSVAILPLACCVRLLMHMQC